MIFGFLWITKYDFFISIKKSFQREKFIKEQGISWKGFQQTKVIYIRIANIISGDGNGRGSNEKRA